MIISIKALTSKFNYVAIPLILILVALIQT